MSVNQQNDKSVYWTTILILDGSIEQNKYILLYIIKMLPNQFNNSTLPNNSPPQILQTQSYYQPNISYSQSNPRPTENITKENRLQFANSQNQRVLGSVEIAELKQSAQNPLNSLVGQSDGINKSAFVSGRTSKYNNKYSFKRHSAVNKTKLTSTIGYVEVSDEANASLRKSQDIFINNQLAQYKTIILQHENTLQKIRDFAYNRRIQEIQSSSQRSSETIRNINDLTEVYNLTLVGKNSNLKFLQFFSENKVSAPVFVQQITPLPQIQSQINIKRPQTQIVQVIPQQRPISYPTVVQVPVQQSVRMVQPTSTNNIERITQAPSPSNTQVQQTFEASSYRYESKVNSQVPKQTGYGYQSFNYQSKYNRTQYGLTKNPVEQPNNNVMNINYSNDSFNQNSQLYNIQIRELRNKIELLQEQKVSLIDKIRVYQKGNGFSNLNTQQTIQTYREEINSLKIQITELTELYNKGHNQKDNSEEIEYLKQSVTILTETVKQYEEQLIQAQNHIIFLQNSRNGDDNSSLQSQVKYLRQTIAKYTEHIEQLDIERQRYEQLLQQKQQDNNSLLQELQENRSYIENLQAHLQKMKNSSNEFNGVTYEIYNNLIAEYGKKTLQSIVLLQEINRLNYRLTEVQNHLEKAEEYIIGLQESFQQQNDQANVQHYNQLTKINLNNQQLIQRIYDLQDSLNNPKIEKVGNAPTPQVYMNHQEYEKLLEELKEREHQSYLLSEQMKRLNEKYSQTREHLEKAEDFIIHLQESKTQLEEGEKARSKLFEQELSKLSLKLSHLQRDLVSQRRQKEGLSLRITTFTTEYEDMEYRYKSALESMGQRYDELLQERNSLISKLQILEARLAELTNKVSQEEFQQLRHNINQLDQQLIQTRNHLQNAQEYIQQNAKLWEQGTTYKERHDQQIIFIETIRRDLQFTQQQNLELSSRLEHYEMLVIELQTLKIEHQRLTIIIREKDNTQMSSSLKQIDEIKQTLNNYVKLYEASLIEIKQLQQQNNSLRIQSSKVTELQEHLLLAENHIIWQQQKIKSLDEFESKNAQLRQHLLKAEQHILYLQDQLDKAHQIIKQLQNVIKIYRNNEINVTLNKADEYLESLSSSKKSL